ncbi:hypothetical protein LTR10_015580 [Elasticomyces elasticus]|uniref:Roadblock/LAMTOR2 domain-containing protein n=1 Tax=Exophiala sideris TaxID=1016849 RepID=A0ABR0JL32_9EURO|nr:hypothetical protein LTR10_015580 [Elasticomyces elasticus]KAK5032292.1 hypothetical protein LTR13_007510 [Exophiala sideris]KAK5036290.1 hypothetical protein LTS07_002016 [Exophiala sideris]KAK5066673.1 hypothetical protein LTR69_002020 [Exophiala sideris]KAK5180495.1 hypothetical protein LTR44_007253 [Eurotiomycetes sp. CCFEE 6388]
MAQTERNQLNGSSIDAILRGLTDRPNVQSTLILSRRDGSIIRATCVDAGEKQNNAGGYQWSVNETKTQVEQVVEVKPGEEGEPDGKLKPVEVLASSIFQFVNNASSLATTLGTTSRQLSGAQSSSFASGESDNRDGATNEDEADIKTSEDEVQLLRLRTKHQEIIVFPDPNYICCVVQRMGKAGNNVDNKR